MVVHGRGVGAEHGAALADAHSTHAFGMPNRSATAPRRATFIQGGRSNRSARGGTRSRTHQARVGDAEPSVHLVVTLGSGVDTATEKPSLSRKHETNRQKSIGRTTFKAFWCILLWISARGKQVQHQDVLPMLHTGPQLLPRGKVRPDDWLHVLGVGARSDNRPPIPPQLLGPEEGKLWHALAWGMTCVSARRVGRHWCYHRQHNRGYRRRHMKCHNHRPRRHDRCLLADVGQESPKAYLIQQSRVHTEFGPTSTTYSQQRDSLPDGFSQQWRRRPRITTAITEKNTVDSHSSQQYQQQQQGQWMPNIAANCFTLLTCSVIVLFVYTNVTNVPHLTSYESYESDLTVLVRTPESVIPTIQDSYSNRCYWHNSSLQRSDNYTLMHNAATRCGPPSRSRRGEPSSN